MPDIGEKSSKKILRIKIISMGNPEVGKSCVIKRFCEKRFVQKYLATIGIDYGVTRVCVKNTDVKVNIFDMAGHPLFYEVRNEFYKDTQGALLVYDVSNRSSFESLERWLSEMKSEVGQQADMDNIVFIVCANKTDRRPRQIEESEGRLWSEGKGFWYFETSAFSGEGVQDMFQTLFEQILTTLETGRRPKLDSTQQLGYNKEQLDAIYRLKNATDNYGRLGLQPGASKEDVNRAYRKLAVILHPDKNVAPGSEEAFKLLVAARTQLLKT